MAELQRYAGGGFGLGGTLAARQFFDETGGNRFMQPSVMFGLGTGALASALYLTDIDTPVIEDDFWAAHAITALPSGAFFAAFPKKRNQSTTEQVRSVLRSPTNGGSGNGSASGERVTVTQEAANGSASGMGRAR